jgi:hypothetical protein
MLRPSTGGTRDAEGQRGGGDPQARRETNANKLRRWCLALLEDHAEMDRKLTAAKPMVSLGTVDSVNGRSNTTGT